MESRRTIISEKNIKDFFLNVNKDIIKYSDTGYIEDIVVRIKSLDCGDLSIAPMGYGVTKMSFLFNSYINEDKLKAFMGLSRSSKKLSIVFDFKEEQGCLKSLVLTRDKVSEPFKRAKVFFRTADLSKKIVPDLFLIRHILEECPNYEHESLTLFISHAYLLPAAIANTYDILLGLNEAFFSVNNPFHKKVLYYIKTSREFDLNNHNRVMGGYFKLLEYKYRELNNIKVLPVTYKECKKKLEVRFNGS